MHQSVVIGIIEYLDRSNLITYSASLTNHEFCQKKKKILILSTKEKRTVTSFCRDFVTFTPPLDESVCLL